MDAATFLQCSARKETKLPGTYPCPHLMRTENPRKSSDVTWLSGTILYQRREKCTFGSASTKQRNSEWDMFGVKVSKLETLTVAVNWNCCRKAVFGQMHTLRTDPEEAWRNKEMHERLRDMQIILDIHPGDASWQASVAENTIGIVKDTMTSIGKTRSSNYRIAGNNCVSTQRDGTCSRFFSCLMGAWTFTKLGSIILCQ